MGQTVLTCLTFKPPGPPPHEKLYGCGLYFALSLPGKQWSRLLSLLQEKPGCVSCALRGHGRAFITEPRQTSASLWAPDKLIIHCEFPGKAIKLWEWVRDLLLAGTGLVSGADGHTESSRPLSPRGGLQDTTSATSTGWDSPSNTQGSSPRPQHLDLQPCFAPALSHWSRVREPGHSGHNQTDFPWNVEQPGGWGIMRMVSNPRGCSYAWWIPTAPAGSKEMNIS